MVSVGEGASAPAASTYGGGGGVGGKATRNQFRRSRATPYDRPPTARRNPSLLSKLVVDPIKNLASSAAHRFFASVTDKRLTPPAPPPLPPESVQEFGDGIGDAVIKSNAEAPKPSNIDGQKFSMADTGGISELEHLLRQKTFTKSEIDHLIELLKSKAVDLQVNYNVKGVGASLSDPVAKFETPLQLQIQSLAAGTGPFSNSANVTNFAASTWSSATSSISPFGSSGTPIFQFGPSVNPSTVVSSSVSTTSDAVPSVGKTNSDKEANASSLSNAPLRGTSFATGSRIFGLCSSSEASTKSSSEASASGFVFSTQSSDVGSGAATISKDAPFQFGSSASSSVFCSSGVSSFMSSSPMFSSSAPANKLFGWGASFGLTSISFGSNWQTPNSSPFGVTTSSPVFCFGGSSSSFSAGNTAPLVFGSTSATSPGRGFSFTMASAGTSVSPASPFTASSPIFGYSTSTFTASGNNDQMSMEDSMAEDVQATAPAIPVFGQQPVSASPGGFAFGFSVPQSVSPFQFGGQQSQAALPRSSPFQASGSMEFNTGGRFSLVSGGGPTDKSNRRIVRPVRNSKHRKK